MLASLVLVDPAVASPTKHTEPLHGRAHRAATTTTVATGSAASSSDNPPLHKARSVPHLSSTARRMDVHASLQQQPHLLAVAGRPPPPPTSVPAYHRHFPRPRPLSSDKIAAAVAGSADLGSPKGLNLDQVNLRHRSQTTSAVSSHSKSKDSSSTQRERAATAAAYSRDNPCDLSYLSGFK